MATDRAARLHRIARDGLVTRSRLARIGYGQREIHRLRASGVIVAVHRDVFRLASFAETRPLLVLAAVMALGDGAVASHLTAAALWALGDVRLAPPYHVSLDRRSQATLHDVVTHHVGTFDRLDRTHLGRTPITAVPRTVVDCADPDAPERTEDIFLDGLRRVAGAAKRVTAILERTPHTRGAALLRELLRRHDPEEVARLLSHLERRYLALFRRAGLPRPRVNAQVFGEGGELVAKLDFWWPQFGLVVEVDGLRYHSTRRQKEHDDRRQNAIVLSGQTVLRYSAGDLDDPDRIVEEVRRAIAMAAESSART